MTTDATLKEIEKQIPRSLERQYGGVIFFMDDQRAQIAEVRERIISLNVEYTMRMASQITFTVLDEELKMVSNNYFSIGRIVAYVSETFGTIESTRLPDVSKRQVQLFEIANVSINQGPGENPTVNVTCYSRAVQQMRRDRKAGTIGGSGTEFVKRAAKKYGLKFWGETTSKSQNINKASSGNKSESLWDVITNLAGEAKFVVFEVDGYLIFASEKFILKRWGTHEAPLTAAQKRSKNKSVKKQNKYIPLTWKNKKFDSTDVREDLQLLQIPNISITENNPWDASGSAQLDRFNAVRLRPGMTIKMNGISDYNGYYLIESVSFSDLSPDPVAISFKKPEKEPKEIKDIPIGTLGPQVIDIEDQVGIDGRTRTYDVFQAGSKFFKNRAIKGIFPLPDADNRTNRYPAKTTGVTQTGNIDIFQRPVLVLSSAVTTLSPIMVHTRRSGYSEVAVLASVWGLAIPEILSQSATIAKYETDGKFLAIVTGSTEKKARANAVAYINRLEAQQYEILMQKFPSGNYVTTPGVE